MLTKEHTRYFSRYSQAEMRQIRLNYLTVWSQFVGSSEARFYIVVANMYRCGLYSLNTVPSDALSSARRILVQVRLNMPMSKIRRKYIGLGQLFTKQMGFEYDSVAFRRILKARI